MSASKNYTPTDGYTEIVKPSEMGIAKLHFGILTLTPDTTFFDHSDDTEVALIALGGSCTLLVGHNGNKAYGTLGERPDVFHGEACIAYIPHHTTYEILTHETDVEIAVCRIQSHSESAAVILREGETIAEGETRLKIWENVFSEGSDIRVSGEAICFQRFRDTDSVAIYDVTRTTETVRAQIYHNDVLTVPDQHNAVLLTSGSSSYQLWIQPRTSGHP